MAKNKNTYKKLPGRKTHLLIWQSTLWMGADHLLAVESIGPAEYYNRFYFRDIQAIILRKTVTGKISNTLMLVMGSIFAYFTIRVVYNDMRYFLGGISAFFFILLMANTILGPSCEVYLQTAVQRKKLSSFFRLKSARKAVSKMRPFIEQYQGNLNKSAETDESVISEG